MQSNGEGGALWGQPFPDRYRLRSRLGRGGQGTVWLAEDRFHDDRLVALKHIDGLDDDRRETLAAEFLTLVRLAHPHIARVRDFQFLSGGRGAYFTTDYVRGGNLLEWIGTVPPSERWRRLLEVAAEALSVFRYLSSQGCVHGDIKPANLLVANDAGPENIVLLKVIDFGTAHREGESPLSGTPAYSPSRGASEAGVHRDLYALGLTLYHVASGTLPFAVGDHRALEEWQQRGEPVRLEQAVQEAPGVLCELIERLTATDPSVRWQSAGAALQFLAGKVALKLPHLSPHDVGRVADEFLDELESSTLDRKGLPVLVGPPGSGKGEVVAQLQARLQVKGFECVRFRGVADIAAEHRLYDCLAESSSTPMPWPKTQEGRSALARDSLVAEMVARLHSAQVTCIVEIEASSEPTPTWALLPRLIAGLQRRPGHLAAPVLGVSSRKDTFVNRLELEGDSVLAVPMLPLDVDGIVDATAEFFGASEVPRGLGERLFSESGGLRRRVLSALQRLAELGSHCDVFGHLRLPRSLPDRLTGSPDRLYATTELSTRLRSALGLLIVAAEPLDAAGAEARFPSGGSSIGTKHDWEDALEDLHAAGYLRRLDSAAFDDPDTGAPESGDTGDGVKRGVHRRSSSRGDVPERRRYELAVHWERDVAFELLGKAETSAAETAALRYLREHLRAFPRSPASLAAAARLRLLSVPGSAPARAGAYVQACRWALEAARRWRGEREDKASAILNWVLERQPTSTASERPFDFADVVRLRSARCHRRAGRLREALEVLEVNATSASALRAPWYVWLRARERARVLEQQGDFEAAAATLERFRADAFERPRGEFSYPVRVELEVLVHLANLYFHAGRRRDGEQSLTVARRTLEAALTATKIRKSNAERWGSSGDVTSSSSSSAALAPLLLRYATLDARHGDGRAAVEFLKEALNLSERLGRQDLQRDAWNELGIVYAKQQDWARALATFESYRGACAEQGDRFGELRGCYNQGLTHYRLFDLDRAEHYFSVARGISESIGPHALSATIWLGLAGVVREKGRFIDAIRLYRRVLRLPSSLARSRDKASALNNLAELYLWLGRLDRAFRCSEEAAVLVEQVGNRFLRGLTLRIRGILHFAMGFAEEARADLTAAQQLAEEDGDARSRASVQHYLGRLAALRGQPREAIQAYRRSRCEGRDLIDLPHFQASTISLCVELVALGRRETPRRLLALHEARRTHWHRGGLSARVLSLQTSNAWPKNWRETVVLLRSAGAEGAVWEAFCSVQDLRRDPALDASAQRELTVFAEVLGGRIAARLDSSARGRFLQFWKLECDSADDAPATTAADADTHLKSTETTLAEPVLAALTGSMADATLEPLMESFRSALRVDRLLLFRDVANFGAPVCVPAEPALSGRLLRRIANWCAGLEEPGRLVRQASFDLVLLPAAGGDRRVLVAETDSGAGPNERISEALFLHAAALLDALLQNRSLREALAGEREKLLTQREESLRLHALASSGGKEVRTALLTQRLDLLQFETSLTGQPSAGRADRSERPRALIGRSEAMHDVLKRLPELAATDLAVVITGESGTGKDLVAKWLHALSPRRDRPFLSQFCSLSEALAEAELFGFVKGAFTDAIDDRPGLLQLLDGGTLYLDEVSDLAASIQAKLLRVLQEHRVRPVGASDAVDVDFRLISSTRYSMEGLRHAAGVRDDLVYRLQGEILELPPLRERQGDVRILAHSFLERAASDYGLAVPSVSDDAWSRWESHTWPGNVRELENEVRRIVGLRLERVDADHVLRSDSTHERNVSPGAPHGSFPARDPGRGVADEAIPNLKDAKRELEGELLRRALRHCDGNATAAAKHLGITRRYLGTLLDRHAIALGGYKSPREVRD